MAELRYEATRQTNGAHRFAAGSRNPGRGAFGCEKAPVEPGVVRHEHSAFERPSEIENHVGKALPAGDQGVGDPREPRDPRGDRNAGIEQRVEREMDRATLEDRDCHLEDAAAAGGGRFGPRRFDVDDGEPAVLERERGDRRVRGHRAGAATSCTGGRRPPAPARFPPW